MEGMLFNIFAGLAVLSALLVVLNPLSRNPVTSAMFLVITMISISGLFVLLGAYFLAAVQIPVYAGAVMVLFLFVIMLLDLQRSPDGNSISLAWPWDPGRGRPFFGLQKFARIDVRRGLPAARSGRERSSGGYNGQGVGSTQALGQALFSFGKRVHPFPFEIVSVLLLVAMVG
ncbi:MAG: NADH dehydrogenase subunit J [Verrucomicrobiota bacterium]|nr:MAG: NADH dehydrogenase subunit J [Verrucomicrobiota bacterium]